MNHKMAIVGFGGMAGWHYDEIQTIEGLEIAGIWDIREERRDYAAREKGLHKSSVSRTLARGRERLKRYLQYSF